MLHHSAPSTEHFRPPWYLRNGHVQTILTGFYRPKAVLAPSTIHKVPLEERGHMLLYENQPEGQHAGGYDPSVGVLLLHGLGSSHASSYMTHLAKRLLERGQRVFRADLPGAGPSSSATPLPPHGACFEEVWQMLQFLGRERSIQKWRVAGISLGGNILLRMLAAKREHINTDSTIGIAIDRAVAVAPPIRLSDCSAHMERGMHQIYAKYFLRLLRRQAIRRAAMWPQWADRLPHGSFRSIRSFDETLTAPLAGFRSAEEYYATGSSAGWLDQIHVPTTVLIDEHDPIVPAWMFDSADWSPTTTLQRTRFGGHVGYLQRANSETDAINSRWTRWADAWIANELTR